MKDLKTEACHWCFMHCLAGLLSSWNMGGMCGFLAVIFVVHAVSRTVAKKKWMSVRVRKNVVLTDCRFKILKMHDIYQRGETEDRVRILVAVRIDMLNS